ncbi:MAG: epoxide hydrolase [Sphingomonadales bacterium]|nr:epoxide hydrolase [Sphingomonadales bacterium]
MRAFRVEIAEQALDDLRARLSATRWIGDAIRNEPGYGATLDFVQALCARWLDGFDWRGVEARINALPGWLAEVDGLDLHFIHRPSPRPDAIPLLLIHGWPSSVLEFLDVCAPLAEPKGDAPAFHVVVPSLPGYGFSQTRPGVSPRRIAAMFAELMTRLGYRRFLVQGGNWGSAIGTEMAREWPERVIGLHLNAINGSPPPADAGIALSPEDRALADTYSRLLAFPHFNLLAQAPLSIAHALNDSPAGLAGWIGEKLRDWADQDKPGNPGLAPDWMLATIALYWLTGTIGSSSALYLEAVRDPLPERFVAVPTAVIHFAGEIVMVPRRWAERHYNIVRWTRHARGGHYAAIEAPEDFVADLRGFAAQLGG